MPDPFRRKPGAFDLSRLADVVCAELSIEDLQQIRPDWTVMQARDFLCRHSSTIGELMIIAGLQGMQQLIDAGDQHD